MFDPIQVGSMSIEVDALDDVLFADRVRRMHPDKIVQVSIVDKYGSGMTVTLTADERNRLVEQLTAI